MLFSSPLNMLSAFMIVSIILYTWFSNKFSRQVLQLQKPVNLKLRDWIKVNAIVATIYSSMVIFAISFLLLNPKVTAELMKNLPPNIPVQLEDFKRLFIFMIVYASFLLIHIIWTFYYIKKYKTFFVETKAE